MLFSKD